MYAFMMSIQNLGGMLSAQTGAVLTTWLNITSHKFGNMWLLIIISNLTMVIVLPAILYIDLDQATLSTESQNTEYRNRKGKKSFIEIATIYSRR